MAAFYPWFWIVLIVVFAIAEGLTVQLVSIWFCVGSVAGLLTSFITRNFGVQFVVFVVVSAIALLISWSLFRDRMRPRSVATNADMVIGKEGVVLCAISPDAGGRVKVDGQDWAAKCDAPLAAGERCKVISLSGVTLTVAPCVLEKKEETVCS